MSRGNHRVDVAAKAAATLPPASASLSSVHLIDTQTFSTQAERDLGCLDVIRRQTLTSQTLLPSFC